MNDKRFRIALSFAGEKRDFVEKVAEILARQFGKDKILYDKYHEAEFAVFNLGIKLPKLYGEQSDLIVPVLCPAYDEKRWTGWEWVHIYGLLTRSDGHRVMPCRFEHANADGLSPASGFIELDQKSPAEAADLIFERLALNEGKARDFYKPSVTGYAVPIKTSIPNNLPSLQPFFGRKEELAKIAAALEPENRGWGALIDGPGGMGKTSLAVRAAYEVSADAFTKIIFVSLKTRELDDDGVRDLSGFILSGLIELFNELASELKRDDIPKAPEGQRPKLLIDALRGTNTLLILDNLESLVKDDRDKLFTFIKRLPEGSKAILTSRGRIGSGAEEIILVKLSREAALETLAELAQRNPLLAATNETERITLYNETAGKPLLLRWTAGQIGRGHCLTFSDALEYLRSCPEGNDPLEFIFGDLVADFSVYEIKVLSALSYFTLPVKAAQIAEIADCFLAVADRALRSLTNRSLVVPSDEMQTFILVPMVAEFLRKHRKGVVDETGGRLEKRAYALIVENGYQKYGRFPTLDAAWLTVAPALPLFLVGPNAQLQTVCGALQTFLNFTGRWDEGAALTQQAEFKAVTSKDLYHAGWRAKDLGSFYSLRGEADETLACADRAENYWREVEVNARQNSTVLYLRAMVLYLRGSGFKLKENYHDAIVAYGKALDLFRSSGAETEDVAACLNAIAEAERLSGNLTAAQLNYREALRVAKKVGDQEGEAIYTGNLAELHLDSEKWLDAENLAREALTQAEKVGRKQLIASNYYYMAKALFRQHKTTEALSYARGSVEIFTNLRSPNLAEAQEMLDICEKVANKEGEERGSDDT